MVQEKVKVINPSGLHLRPAGLLSKIAGKCDSDITLGEGGQAGESQECSSAYGGRYPLRRGNCRGMFRPHGAGGSEDYCGCD